MTRAGRGARATQPTTTTPPQIVDQLRAAGQRRTHLAWERLGEPRDDQPSPNEAYRRLRRKMLKAEREEVLRIRDTGTVDDDVLDEVMQTLDLEESMLTIADDRNARYEGRVILTPESQRGDCEHLQDAPQNCRPNTPEGCEDCLREGPVWVHLRMCLDLRQRRLLRLLDRQPRHEHFHEDRAPGDAQLRARRGLALVLRRRAPRLTPASTPPNRPPPRRLRPRRRRPGTAATSRTCLSSCRDRGRSRATRRTCLSSCLWSVSPTESA